MLILHPYDTRIGSNYDIEGIVEKIMQSERMYPKSTIDIKDKLFAVTSEAVEVPTFNHPIISDNKMYVYIDGRTLVSIDRTGDIKIRSGSAWEFETKRAMLSLGWAQEEQGDFLSLGDTPLRMFINWVATLLSRNLVIDPLVQYQIGVLAGVTYMAQHYDDDRLNDERTMLKITERIARVMRSSMTDVTETIVNNNIDVAKMRDIAGLVTAIKNLGTVRTDGVSIAYMYRVLGNSWFGNNGPEIASMALEHPPTWMTMLFTAINDRSYRKSGVGQLAQTFVKPNDAKEFTRSYELLLKAV